jgi:hypothetical protein
MCRHTKKGGYHALHYRFCYNCSAHSRSQLWYSLQYTLAHKAPVSTFYVRHTAARIYISCYLRLITHHSQPCTMTQRGARDHVCCDRSAHSRSQLCRLLQHTLAQKAPVYTFNGSYFTHCSTPWHAKHPCLHSTRCNRCPHFHLLLSAPANTSFTVMHDDATRRPWPLLIQLLGTQPPAAIAFTAVHVALAAMYVKILQAQWPQTVGGWV